MTLPPAAFKVPRGSRCSAARGIWARFHMLLRPADRCRSVCERSVEALAAGAGAAEAGHRRLIRLIFELQGSWHNPTSEMVTEVKLQERNGTMLNLVHQVRVRSRRSSVRVRHVYGSCFAMRIGRCSRQRLDAHGVQRCNWGFGGTL